MTTKIGQNKGSFFVQAREALTFENLGKGFHKFFEAIDFSFGFTKTNKERKEYFEKKQIAFLNDVVRPNIKKYSTEYDKVQNEIKYFNAEYKKDQAESNKEQKYKPAAQYKFRQRERLYYVPKSEHLDQLVRKNKKSKEFWIAAEKSILNQFMSKDPVIEVRKQAQKIEIEVAFKDLHSLGDPEDDALFGKDNKEGEAVKLALVNEAKRSTIKIIDSETIDLKYEPYSQNFDKLNPEGKKEYTLVEKKFTEKAEKLLYSGLIEKFTPTKYDHQILRILVAITQTEISAIIRNFFTLELAPFTVSIRDSINPNIIIDLKKNKIIRTDYLSIYKKIDRSKILSDSEKQEVLGQMVVTHTYDLNSEMMTRSFEITRTLDSGNTSSEQSSKSSDSE